MPSFKLRTRLTGPIVDKDVDAESRDHAVNDAINGVPDDGSTIEIMDVKEIAVQEAMASMAKAAPHAAKEHHSGKK